MSELGEHLFHQLTASVISQLSALLQLKYQTQSPFPALPTPVLLAGYCVTLYYLICVLIHLFSTSRFAAVAHHFLVWSAYAAVCTLALAVLPPASAPFLYTICGLLLVGRMLYLFGGRLIGGVEADADTDRDRDGDVITSKLKVYGRRVCRFLKNICRSVANFFRQQQPILPR